MFSSLNAVAFLQHPHIPLGCAVDTTLPFCVSKDNYYLVLPVPHICCFCFPSVFFFYCVTSISAFRVAFVQVLGRLVIFLYFGEPLR